MTHLEDLWPHSNMIFRFVIFIYITIIISTSIVVMYSMIFRYTNLDFVSFMIGGETAKQGRLEKLYDLSYQQQIRDSFNLRMGENAKFLVFKYLPIYAYLFIPLTFFNYSESIFLYYILNILLAFLSVFITLKAKNSNKKTAYIVPFASFFIIYTLTSAHTFFPLFIFTLIYYSLSKEKWYLLGIFASLLTFKIQYLFFLPFLLLMIKNKKRFFISFLISVLLILLINIEIYGPNLFTEYIRFILNTETPYYGSNSSGMVSLVQAIKSMTVNTNMSLLIVINMVFYITVLIGLYYMFKKRRIINSDYFFIGAFLLSTFFSIHAWPPGDILILMLVILFIENSKTNYKLMFLFILYSMIIMFLGTRVLALSPFVLGLYLMYLSYKHVKAI